MVSPFCSILRGDYICSANLGNVAFSNILAGSFSYHPSGTPLKKNRSNKPHHRVVLAAVLTQKAEE